MGKLASDRVILDAGHCTAESSWPFALPLKEISSIKSYALCVALVTLGMPAFADDWPQWQGPDRNAVSKEKGLLQDWPKAGPPLAWRVKGIGGGDSAPSVAGGKLFGMSNRGDDEIVWALSEVDGKELWLTRLGPAFQQRVPQSKEGPSCTPTVDGDKLYVLGVGGDLACLQVKDGSILWRVNLTGLTITGGKTLGAGGGINAPNSGDNVTLNNCTISENTAGTNGGGVVARGNVTMTSCTVSGEHRRYLWWRGGCYWQHDDDQ
jgi:outer membrane protein assembly factor BamB